ncbi:MAG: hypothetical protein WA885_12620 [Phormidesmis sp.]
MPIEIVQGIAAFKNSVDSLNLLKNYADEIKDTRKRGELMRVIGELSIELGNAQLQLAQQMRANNQLLQDVAKLEAENEDLRSLKAKLVLNEDNFLYSEDGAGPFCTACYYDRGKTMPLHNMMNIKFEALGQNWGTAPTRAKSSHRLKATRGLGYSRQELDHSEKY